jgi:hypothetical protein
MSFTTFKARLAQAAAILTSNGEKDALPVTNEFRELVPAGYNWLSRAIRGEEVNPLPQQYVEQTFVSSSNVTTSSMTSLYYYPSSAGASMNGYRDIATELCLSSSSGSIFVWVQGTTQTVASPEWVDITQMAYSYGTNTGSYSSFSVATGATNWIIAHENLNLDRVRYAVQIDYANTNRIEISTKMKAH